MARREHSREDLLAEATALVERIALTSSGATSAEAEQPVVIGFRAGGQASLSCGEDPAYHFNSAGELRRAFIDGRLLKAERGRLITLTRGRTDREVQLVSCELSADECRDVIDILSTRASAILAAIRSSNLRVAGQVPSGADVLTRAEQFLESVVQGVRIAQTPRVG